jgi:hypothetical protein
MQTARAKVTNPPLLNSILKYGTIEGYNINNSALSGRQSVQIFRIRSNQLPDPLGFVTNPDFTSYSALLWYQMDNTKSSVQYLEFIGIDEIMISNVFYTLFLTLAERLLGSV